MGDHGPPGPPGVVGPEYTVYQSLMLKNHWSIITICLFGQTIKQPLSNFDPGKSWKYKQL